MINRQKFKNLLFLTINSVTTGVRELNGIRQMSLVTTNAKGENARDLDVISSGRARMLTYTMGEQQTMNKQQQNHSVRMDSTLDRRGLNP